MYKQKYLKYRAKYLNLKNEIYGGFDPIDSTDPLILQSVRQLFEKYSEIRYQNKTLYEIEEKLWTTYTLNQILLRTIPNDIEDPNKVEDQRNLIRFGANLTHIDNHAFYYNNLRSITIPSTIRTIGNYAFAANRLVQVIIPESVKYINENAFSNNQLNKLFIPDSVIIIGNNAFANNNLLEQVTIPIKFYDFIENIFGPNVERINFIYT